MYNNSAKVLYGIAPVCKWYAPNYTWATIKEDQPNIEGVKLYTYARTQMKMMPKISKI